jgi:hypothetical protein
VPADESGSGGGVSFQGDWSSILRRLRAASERIDREVRLATEQNCQELVGAIKTGLTSGTLADGSKLAALHPFTVMQRLGGVTPERREELLHALASGKPARPLFNHGDLARSFTYALSPDGWSGVVGVNRHAKAQGGDAMINIAAVQFKGATIRVTEAMRGYLGAHGLHLKKSTTHLTIPARDPVTPTFNALREKMIERYRAAVRRAAGLRGGEA